MILSIHSYVVPVAAISNDIIVLIVLTNIGYGIRKLICAIINTQFCELHRSNQFYVPFWGQPPKAKPNNSLIFNKLNEKASPAFAPKAYKRISTEVFFYA